MQFEMRFAPSGTKWEPAEDDAPRYLGKLFESAEEGTTVTVNYPNGAAKEYRVAEPKELIIKRYKGMGDWELYYKCEPSVAIANHELNALINVFLANPSVQNVVIDNVSYRRAEGSI